MNPIEIIAESPLSAAIVVATVLVAISHELAIASRGQRAFRMARVLWGPYFVLLVLFIVIACRPSGHDLLVTASPRVETRKLQQSAPAFLTLFLPRSCVAIYNTLVMVKLRQRWRNHCIRVLVGRSTNRDGGQRNS